jgi:hypothetical protein
MEKIVLVRRNKHVTIQGTQEASETDDMSITRSLRISHARKA